MLLLVFEEAPKDWENVGGCENKLFGDGGPEFQILLSLHKT